MAVSKKQRTSYPQRFKDSTPLERIEARFASIANGLSCEAYVPLAKTERLYQVAPVPRRALGVGVSVTIDGNPVVNGRIVAIGDGGLLQVYCGKSKGVVEILANRCKALVPVGAAIGEVKNVEVKGDED